MEKPQSCDEMECHHDCQTTNNGPLCTCRHGYKLNGNDNKTCDGKYESKIHGRTNWEKVIDCQYPFGIMMGSFLLKAI